VILSSIGLIFSAAMIRFWSTSGAIHPKWWLGGHLNSVLLLSSAVHGTLLAVVNCWLIDANGFDAAELVTQPGRCCLRCCLGSVSAGNAACRCGLPSRRGWRLREWRRDAPPPATAGLPSRPS
jgi:hypothetical protein